MPFHTVIYTAQPSFRNTAFIKGSANFIFYHIAAASFTVTFVYDVFYAVRIYIRVGY